MSRQPMTIDDHDHEKCNPNDENCNYNRYATKKTLANGGFEIALLITNAVQLKRESTRPPPKKVVLGCRKILNFEIDYQVRKSDKS